ncbi:MAG: hypothetical protein CL912_02225 [Deltaproteobacteria bacterium]|nr:hypothetical protein [Deltaproteobacteria bacterium]
MIFFRPRFSFILLAASLACDIAIEKLTLRRSCLAEVEGDQSFHQVLTVAKYWSLVSRLLTSPLILAPYAFGASYFASPSKTSDPLT